MKDIKRGREICRSHGIGGWIFCFLTWYGMYLLSTFRCMRIFFLTEYKDAKATLLLLDRYIWSTSLFPPRVTSRGEIQDFSPDCPLFISFHFHFTSVSPLLFTAKTLTTSFSRHWLEKNSRCVLSKNHGNLIRIDSQ